MNNKTNDSELHNQLAENMRFYADMRFKLLTLFITWMTLTGVLMAQWKEVELIPLLKVKTIIALIAMFFTAVIWVMEIKALLYWVANRQVATCFWPRPRPNIFSSIVNASNMVILLYIVVYFFWLWCALILNAHCILIFLGIVIGISLLVFTIVSYLPLWKYKEPI